MASKLVGRIQCVYRNCNFGAAHVKIRTDKDNAMHYVYCPECRRSEYPKDKVREEEILAETRPENHVATGIDAVPVVPPDATTGAVVAPSIPSGSGGSGGSALWWKKKTGARA